MKALILLFSVILFSHQQSVTPNPKTDQINIAQAFPSLANQNIGNLYSGYIQLSATRLAQNYIKLLFLRILHYWYAEVRSPLLPANVPLIAWFNGGPGCSSMDGALYENGPFYFQAETFNTTPIANPYSWNTIANVLYIEMPAGVGFSVKNDNYPQDDYTVATDNVQAIIQFLNGFNLWNNELYVMGESYAGVYVPYLSKAIIDYNAIQQANNAQTINFQGFSTGNGCTSPLAGECYFVQSPFLSPLGASQGLFLYEQGFLSQTQFITFYEYCYLPETMDIDLCYDYVGNLYNYVGMNYQGQAPFINLYDVYRYCALQITNQTANQQRVVNEKDFGYKEVEKAKKNREWKQFCATPEECESLDVAIAGDTATPGSPCIDSTAAHTYLNNKTNWPLIGINPQYYAPNFVYTLCIQSQDQMDFTRSFNGSYWIYPEIVALNKYKIMIYSGNTDLCVPISGTRQWIDQLRREAGLGLVESMRNWYYYPDPPASDPGASMPQTIAGTVEEYDSHFRFVTVNGVGHMVPMWNRKASLAMVEAFINWMPLPGYGQLTPPGPPQAN